MRSHCAVLFLIFVGASAPGQGPLDGSGPGDKASGIDVATLRQLTKDIRSGKFTNTHAVLIEHRGKLVFEEYFRGRDERFAQPLGTVSMTADTLHDLRSISKSVTSALLGICLRENFETAVNRSIGEYLPDLSLTESQRTITLHHVLTMTTGLKWNEMDVSYADPANDAIRLYSVKDPASELFSRQMARQPGTTWYYNGGCTYLLGEIILKQTGMTVDEYAREKLFRPLGIKRFEWIGGTAWNTANPSAAAGLRLTARDLTRIGTLFLNEGKWNGHQVVPKEWVSLSTRRHVKSLGKWSGNGIWGYGYQWQIGTWPQGNRRVIAGVGNGNQRLYIIPRDDLVVTIFAGQYSLPFEPYSERILRRILETRNDRLSEN